MKHPVFLAFGIVVIGLAAFAEWRGWSMNRVSEARVAPRTVRENPGVYRPIYVGGGGRYMRGK